MRHEYYYKRRSRFVGYYKLFRSPNTYFSPDKPLLYVLHKLTHSYNPYTRSISCMTHWLKAIMMPFTVKTRTHLTLDQHPLDYRNQHTY